MRKYRDDPNRVAYIVALADAARAMELIRAQAAAPGDDVEDLGRVSEALLMTLNLGTGQFMRL